MKSVDSGAHGARATIMMGADSIGRGGLAMIDGFVALYIFMLAAVTGYEIIGRVPVILHTPLMSGSNFIHGIVLVGARSEEHTSELQSLMRISYAVFCLKKKTNKHTSRPSNTRTKTHHKQEH